VNDLAAIVLAAGAGTRLRPLTLLRPKPLCPVNNVPLVDHALTRVAAVTNSAAVNVHHGRGLLEMHLAGRVHLSIEEKEALGTAGAVGHLREWIDGRNVLVVNGDSWHDAPLTLLTDGWDAESVRLMVVEDPEHADFEGRWRFAGASLMPWAEARILPAEPSGLYEVLWQPVRDAGRLELIAADGVFFDCGTPSEYLAANLYASGGESVVGAGADVAGRLERCVVWPFGVVREGESLRECIRAGRETTVEAPLSARFRALIGG
jgi:MurNAc alpha-1-phosphate uridylyltransferase